MLLTGWIVERSVRQSPHGKIPVGYASIELPSTWYRSALAHPCSTQYAYHTLQWTEGDILLQVSNSWPVKQPLPCTTNITCTNNILVQVKTLFVLLSHYPHPSGSIIPTWWRKSPPAQTAEYPSRHARAYQPTVTSVLKGKGRQNRKSRGQT